VYDIIITAMEYLKHAKTCIVLPMPVCVCFHSAEGRIGDKFQKHGAFLQATPACVISLDHGINVNDTIYTLLYRY